MMFLLFVAPVTFLACLTQCEAFGTHLISSRRAGSSFRGVEYVGQPEDELTCDPTVSWDHHWKDGTKVNELHEVSFLPQLLRR